ncbi:DegT/DnrJ/EryC1/StrS family aminotransferase [Riemerella columbina]|uniref:DegT/DnrJ/EryC1/StrS family aminotransferase n=1 Tax=Riemerella columbina TaxID=103810 RepID=UPI000367900B|nr:DegT/DnrJ/EryC1/StrS family aminotransferase [Riemerella columbina]
MLNVTKTYLPPIEEYIANLQEAYDRVWLTNRGHLVLKLEKELKQYLDINNLILTANGTLPLQIAIKALGLEGEVITTPFSYVATTSSIVWEGCKPIFVDIESDYLTIDPKKIEKAITPKTSAILTTHVFGNPCDVEAIDKIAKKHNLKVIYDAAHAFAVNYKGRSLLSYGDVSTCSFHATKIFHCGEGGCMIANNEVVAQRLFKMHNFGHETPVTFDGVGINAKMSELQAAMGLAVFNHLEEILSSRKKAVELYTELLKDINIKLLKIRSETEWNYHYFPVIFETEEILLTVQKSLNNKNIFPRRYFYPSLNTLNYVASSRMPVSEDICKRILCLPLSTDIDLQDIEIITKIIRKSC